MRICYITKTCIGHFTSSDAIYHVPLSLARRWRLTLITGESTAERDIGRFLDAEVVVPGGSWSRKAFGQLRKLHKIKPVDLVISGIDEASLIPAMLGQIVLGIPWIAVCEDHPFQSRYEKTTPLGWVERVCRTWFLRAALRASKRLLYFIHPDVLNYLWIKRSIKLPLTNSADLEAIEPIRAELEIRSPAVDQGLIAYVGLVNEPKGAPYMLEVFRRVVAARPGARLRLIGKVDPRFHPTLLRLIREYQLEDSIELTGQLSAEDALRRAAEAEVCIHAYSPRPWLYWNQVLKICEYMALGKAVVSVDYPGTRSLIEHGKSGLLVPWGDPRAMADGILMLLKDAALRGRIEQGALERSKEISWGETEKKVFAVIESIVNQ